MKRHMKRHFADRETYDCVACSKSFTRKDKLRDHLKSARHILTVFGPNALPAGNERPTEAAHSPSSASSPEHPGPSSDALSSLPQTEREIVRFMEKLRTMGKLEGLPMDAAGPLQQLATTGSVFNGNVIGANNGTMGVSDTEGDDQEDEAEGDAAPENNDDRVPESVESPPLSVSPANESS
ncbi:uncharacterized protein LOC111272975 [Varroa jacobsoni]|nr:uncharacterized protein LOC111272975 [Varroa jacobsoni]